MIVRRLCLVAVHLTCLVHVALADNSTDGVPSPLPEVISIRIGFGNRYKLGCWTPVEVAIGGEPRQIPTGSFPPLINLLEIQAPDDDSIPTRFIEENRQWTGGGNHLAYARIGRPDGPLNVYLHTFSDVEGQEKESLLRSFSGSNLPTALPATNEFILELGASIGLPAMLRGPDQRDLDRTTVVAIDKPQKLPDRWYGYEGVDLIVIVGKPAIENSLLDVAAVDALEQWVRLGGTLVIVCGEGAEATMGTGAPLARFAPGQFETMVAVPATTANIGPIESFASAEHLEAKSLSVPQWTDVAGRIELSVGAGQTKLPLIVRSPLAFGQVVFVGLDLHQPPFADWPSRGKFLEKLLCRNGSTGQQAHNEHGLKGASQTQRLGIVDLSGQLRSALDQFDDIQLIPFWAVAVTALIYVAILFPASYWIVTRWLNRPRLAWIVFPATIVVFGAGAMAWANYAKGTSRHVNQVDLVDVDRATGLVRGTTWFNLFSSENAVYDMRLNLNLPIATSKIELPAGANGDSHVLLSWFGLAGKGVGAMNSAAANAPLFDQPYTIDPQRGAVHGVPLSIWSSKSFVARWEAMTDPISGIETDVSTASDGLLGTLVNRLAVPLSDCMVLFNDWVYPLQELKPNQIVNLDRRDKLHIDTHLTKRHIGAAATSEVTPYDRAGFDVARIVELMMFHDKAGGENYTGLLNRQQPFTDLSAQLQFNQAILVGRAPDDPSAGAGRGAVIVLNGKPIADSELNLHITIYRFLLPVKARKLKQAKS